MPYPPVLSEHATLTRVIHGRANPARFGDGELRLATGGSATAQAADPALAKELRNILAGKTHALPCIPNMTCNRPDYWRHYEDDKYTSLYSAREFGSSFITRPDNARSIDTAEYWSKFQDFWRDRNVLYVYGEDKGLAEIVARQSKTCACLTAPRRDAYAQVDLLEAEIIRWFTATNGKGRVVMSLGPTATVLAHRLATKVHALDAGHAGMFMRPGNIGAFSFTLDDLCSPEYRAELKATHEAQPGNKWGKTGHSWADQVDTFAKRIGGIKSLIDYGAGQQTLANAMTQRGYKVQVWDPGVRPELLGALKLTDLVMMTDVAEHVEPEKIDNVLRHVFLLSKRGAFIVPAKLPAKRILVHTGRNAHLICESTAWWVAKLRKAGWSKITVTYDAKKKFVAECEK